MGFMDFVHGALDVAGFIPGVGAIADGINAGIYAAEGDWGNAALSLAAAVPGVGDAAAVVGKTAKIAGKAAKAAKTTKAAKTVKAAKAAKSSKILSKLKGMCSWIKNIAGKAKTGAKKIADKLSKVTDFVKQKLRNKKKSKKAGSCFTGDMTVCVENGYCFITEIQNGDDIYTRNAETGEEGIRKVYNAVQSEAHTIYHIQLDGKEEIKTTAYHPFFVKEKGWVNAINLKDGDLLETMAGEVLVTKIFKIRHEEPVKVYNFQVEEWESYFVSGMQVYVHNGGGCGKNRSTQKDSAKKESSAGSAKKPYTNGRPSFRKGTVEKVWENAKGPDGLVRDPNTGDVINWKPGESRKGVWDMGHIPEAKYSDMHEKYMRGEMTTEEFVDWYNDPGNYRPELPGNNRSHKYE